MKNEVKNSETVTITKAEYESFKSLKEHCANLESELNWLKEQLQISKKKTFGSSSERTEQLYDGISLLFNEAELKFYLLLIYRFHFLLTVIRFFRITVFYNNSNVIYHIHLLL